MLRAAPAATAEAGRLAPAVNTDPDDAIAFAGLPRLRISIGDVSAQARPTMLRTLLGSCVAVCLHDPTLGIGGMNHIFLPGEPPGTGVSGASTHGVHAMELLINRLMQLGCAKKSLVAKAFGAANVLPCFKSPTVGERNASFVQQFLVEERIPLLAHRLGGASAMDVRFRTDTGYVLLHTLNAVQGSSVERAEQRSQCRAERAMFQSEAAILF